MLLSSNFESHCSRIRPFPKERRTAVSRPLLSPKRNFFFCHKKNKSQREGFLHIKKRTSGTLEEVLMILLMYLLYQDKNRGQGEFSTSNACALTLCSPLRKLHDLAPKPPALQEYPRPKACPGFPNP